MKASAANLLNAEILIVAGYFLVTASNGSHSPTALIPGIFGIAFLAMQKGLAAENKVIAHLVVVLTVLLLGVCVWRFALVHDWEAKKYIFLVCILSNAFATIAFVRSFIAARKNRAVNNG